MLNEGHTEAKPTVVLGISGKPEKMCNLELIQRDKVRSNGVNPLGSTCLYL